MPNQWSKYATKTDRRHISFKTSNISIANQKITFCNKEKVTHQKLFDDNKYTSGMMATVAVDVCTRPWVSVRGTR